MSARFIEVIRRSNEGRCYINIDNIVSVSEQGDCSIFLVGKIKNSGLNEFEIGVVETYDEVVNMIAIASKQY